MQKIINLTPHAITIIDGAKYDPSIRKWVGGAVVTEIPSAGKTVNVLFEEAQGNPVECIPCVKKNVVGLDPLPEGYEIYIVSRFYANAYRQKYGADDVRLYSPGSMVLSPDGKKLIGTINLVEN